VERGKAAGRESAALRYPEADVLTPLSAWPGELNTGHTDILMAARTFRQQTPRWSYSPPRGDDSPPGSSRNISEAMSALVSMPLIKPRTDER
jgi:hypothetical protein